MQVSAVMISNQVRWGEHGSLILLDNILTGIKMKSAADQGATCEMPLKAYESAKNSLTALGTRLQEQPSPMLTNV
jgi:hypothetical protein